MQTDFIDWLMTGMTERGWDNSELARRAGVVPSTISMILSGRNKPGPKVCAGIAQALGLPADTVQRMAGLLPPLPAEVEDEQELLGVYRQLDRPVRRSMLETMRSLLGLRVSRPRLAERQADYEVEPQTLSEHLQTRFDRELAQVHPDDAELVLELMERLRGDRRGEIRPSGSPVTNE